jgi:hypothetical protein
MRGTASPTTVGLPFGSIPLRGVRLDTIVTLAGMANLTNPPASITSGDIYRTSLTTINVTVGLNITNPSTLTGSFGPVAFGVLYKKDTIGTYDTPYGRGFIITTLPNLKVNSGMNTFESPGVFSMPDSKLSPKTHLLAEELLGRFLSQIDSNCTLEGFDSKRDGGPGDTSDSYLLQPALGSLRAAAIFPGIPIPLVTHAVIITDTTDLNVAAAEPTSAAIMRLSNALSVNITLVQASLTMYLCQSPIKDVNGFNVRCSGNNFQQRLGFFYNGSLAGDFNGGLVVGAKQFGDFQLNLTNLADYSTLTNIGVENLFDEVALGKGNGTVHVNLTDVYGGAPFSLTINITQNGIPICVKGAIDFACDFAKAAPGTPGFRALQPMHWDESISESEERGSGVAMT